jgi:hypothetical protein
LSFGVLEEVEEVEEVVTKVRRRASSAEDQERFSANLRRTVPLGVVVV